MTDWPILRLGDHVDSCLGKMLDAQKNRGSFQPYLGNSNVRWGVFDFNDLASMRFEQHEEERYSLQNGDLVICEGGEPGRCAIWRDPIPGMKIQKALHRVRVKNRLNGEYLYYWFLHAGRTGALEPYFTGTTIKHLTGRALAELKIPCPPPQVQYSIGEILKSLDHKIELNRRMNETLEAMAQAIFRDWFVDFGPVRRKLEGASDPVAIMGGLMPDPARAAELAGLFPGEFGEDELPVGWSASTVGDTFNLTMGQSPPGETYNDTGDGLPFFQGRTDFGFRFPERRKFCSQPTRIANPDDTLISVRAPVGDLNMAWEECCIGRGVAAARHQAGGKTYTYYAMRHLQPELEQFESEGTVFGAINKKQFEQLPIVDPDARLVHAFEAVAGALDDRLRIAVTENRTLAETRDYLLPRLMSGEVRVGDVQPEVAA